MSTQNLFPKLPKVSIWKIRSENIMNGSSLQKGKSSAVNSQGKETLLNNKLFILKTMKNK
jgi:hypothetical protein